MKSEIIDLKRKRNKATDYITDLINFHMRTFHHMLNWNHYIFIN